MSAAKAPPVAIIGIGCLFPKAPDLASYWSNIKHSIDGISEVPRSHWRPEDYFDPDPKAPDMTYSRQGGFIEPVSFDPLEFGIAPNAIEATDTTQLLGLVAAREALADAGYAADREFDRERVSVVLGVTGTLPLVIPLGARLGHPLWRRALKEAGVAAEVAEDVVRRIGDGYVPWQEASFPGLLGNVAAGRIASRLDLHGTNCVVDAACASSLSAVHLASLELGAGHCDLAVSGGLDTFNDIFMFMCFSKTPALSPSGHARPFDRDADGTTLGEGLGLIVLKRLEDAERDGDRIYAVIRGMGSSSDGRGQAIYAPSSAGQRRALERAYEQTEISPRTVELVEAHGTGTRVGDSVELRALSEVYEEAGGDEPWCAVGSVKSQIGHTKAAAGAASLIKVALALHDKVLPPTLKVEAPSDTLDPAGPLYVNGEPRPWLARPDHPRRGAVSSFGFGGSNFHCLLEEYRPERAEVQWNTGALLIAFSDATPAGLEEQIASWPRGSSGSEVRRQAALSRRDFAPEDELRLLLVPGSPDELDTLLDEALVALRKNPESSWSTPRGVTFGRGPCPGGLAVLFPGQGAQYPGMLRDLACCFPEMLESLEEANRAFGGPGRLSDEIYPRAAFDDETRSEQNRSLRATEVAQPALGAVEYGAYRLLADRFAVQAAAFAGHSYGELAALAAAGRLEPGQLHRLSGLRGQLMAGGPEDGDPGSMLAVQSEQELAPGMVDLALVVANRNTPRQFVLSGPTDAVQRTEDRLRGEGIRCTRLDVSAAFHSRLVAGAEEPLAEALADFELPPSSVPVYANSTAAPYPEAATEARALLAGQLARPVEFVAEVEALYEEAGCRTFLELGPGRRLSGMVSETLGDREHRAVALDASSGRASGEIDLARALAALAAAGHPVTLTAWDPAATELPEPQDSGFRIELSGANHFEPPPARPPAAPVAAPARTLSGPSSPLPEGERSELMEALRVSQEGLTALQRLQEQTAELHRRYLDGQEAAQRSFHELLAQQRRLVGSDPGPELPPIETPIWVSSPVPETLPEPAPAPVQSSPSAPNAAPILLEVVSEKTGYPADMLDLDMGLDADLGIDSIKRVEILSALRERLPGAPEIAADHLAALHTLREIADALQGAEEQVLAEEPGTAVPDASAVLLAVVAEKTGYPSEMLELDMGLDADLGIDSIKRVEILSALREKLPGAPEIAADHLATLHTLREIADALQGAEEHRPVPILATAAGPEAGALLLEVVAEKTGYPAEMLDLDMGLDADLGIDSIKRVEILSALREKLPGAPEIAADQLAALHTLREIADALASSAPVREPPRTETVEALVKPTATTGVYRQELRLRRLPPVEERNRVSLPEAGTLVVAGGGPLGEELVEALRSNGRSASWVTLGDEPEPGPLAGLILVASAGELPDDFALTAFRTLRAAAPALRANPGSRLLTVSRLDGRFALGPFETEQEVLSGSLAGLAKTAAREWPEVSCTALDLAPDLPEPATGILLELFRPGEVEIGLTAEGSFAPELVPIDLPEASGTHLTSADTVIVTGGARGVTAEVVETLARAGQPRLILLGRTPEPGPTPEWLEGLHDEAAIKAELFRRLDEPSPRKVESAYRRVRAEAEIRHNLERFRAAGSPSEYRAVDVRDRAALEAMLHEVEEASGPVTALVHGAGVLADKRIEEKTDDDFRSVFSTKVEGLLHLLELLRERPLRSLVLFSSSTGRFGRIGQADYAAANEVLNKIAQREARRRPKCRVLSVNWGPWDGGMVTPELKKLFEREGIELIPPAAGASYLLDELSGTGPVEVVVLGAKPPVTSTAAIDAPGELPLAFERQVDLESHPCLGSHVFGGRPVFPVALIMEWLAHAALHGNPGLHFHGFEDLRVLKGLTFEAGRARLVQARAGLPSFRNGSATVPVELTSETDEERALHARGNVVLTQEEVTGEPRLEASSSAAYPAANGLYPPLFHGPDLQGIRRVEGWSEQGIEAEVKSAPNPSEWVRSPLRNRWICDPMALDGAFQLMILWTLAARDVGSLPTALQRYRQFRPFPSDGVRIVANVSDSSEHRATADIELLDSDGKLVARIEGYECVLDPSLEDAFRQNSLAERQAS